ncbi:hypothetical protein VNO78_00636 [Psophocarpus tetragonolobus]|uniref:Uncharacterized protein n=1 Tax=Psophocarpus tetragonolobus TaxID=3891 RepID=A0AAN9T0Q4_PSOTE
MITTTDAWKKKAELGVAKALFSLRQDPTHFKYGKGAIMVSYSHPQVVGGGEWERGAGKIRSRPCSYFVELTRSPRNAKSMLQICYS